MSFTQPRHGAGGEAAAGLNCAADHPRMNKVLAPRKSILKTHGARKKKCVRFADPTAGISEMQDISALFRALLSLEEKDKPLQLPAACANRRRVKSGGRAK